MTPNLSSPRPMNHEKDLARLKALLRALEITLDGQKRIREMQIKQGGGSKLHYTGESNLLIDRKRNIRVNINQMRQKLWLF